MIRPMRPADLPAVRDVIESVGLFPPELMDDMVADHFAGRASDQVWAVVDEDGARAVLYAEPERMTSGTWNCLLLAVHEGHRRRGWGGRLMAWLEADLAARGAHLLLVETSGVPEFEDTRRFYRRIGYEEEARIRDFYQPGEGKVVFRKALGR